MRSGCLGSNLYKRSDASSQKWFMVCLIRGVAASLCKIFMEVVLQVGIMGFNAMFCALSNFSQSP